MRADIPETLRHAVIGRLPDGRTAYDALHDPELSRYLLTGMAEQRQAGGLVFAREPGVSFGTWPGERVIAAEQSNTSVVYGDAAILKVLRRLFPGANPDLEVAGALARLGSVHVAPPYGWIADQPRRRAGAARRAVPVPGPGQRRLVPGRRQHRPAVGPAR